jgi:hypothetical protein
VDEIEDKEWITDEREWISEIFSKYKKMFETQVSRYLRRDWFDAVDREKALEEVFIKIWCSPQSEKGFKDKNHLIRYSMIAIRNYCKRLYFVKETEMMYPKLNSNQLAEQYRLARNIIDKARPVK